MTTDRVPVDLDAVEERVIAQWGLRSVAIGCAAALCGLFAYRAAPPMPPALHVALASTTAAAVWVGGHARQEGASLPTWAARAVRFALAPRLFLASAHVRAGARR